MLSKARLATSCSFCGYCGLCSREIINTLSPFSQFLLDTRVEFIIVTPINNIGVIEKKISAVFVPDQGEGLSSHEFGNICLKG